MKRVAIVSATKVQGPPPDYVQSLAKGFESLGHHVEIFNAWTDDSFKLPTFNYIVCTAEATAAFKGTMPACLPKFLGGPGAGVSGKKGAAFLRKGMLNGKALHNLMKAMEHEGMVVDWSDIILSAPHAEALGKRYTETD
jgi:hypothetical protein